MSITSNYDWRSFWTITLAGISALMAQIIAGLDELRPIAQSDVTSTRLILFLIVNISGITLVCFFGLLVSSRIDLRVSHSDSFRLSSFLKTFFIVIFLASVVISLDYVLFTGIILENVKSLGGFASRLSLAYSAGIGEEIFFRLFILSVLIWAVRWKISSIEQSAWIGIIISALIFAAAHLPKHASELTFLIACRSLLLNGIGGIVFGWLFWKRGLAAAMVAHFSANAVLYILLPLVAG